MVCIYCGKTIIGQERTKEHVIPQWIIKELGIEKEKCYFLPVSKHLKEFPITKPVTNTLVHKVCKSCNNGWLSEIDNSCNQLLNLMIKNEKYNHLLLIYINELHRLVYKILLNFIATGPEEFKREKLRYFQNFFKTKNPPENTELYISKYLAEECFSISSLDQWMSFGDNIDENIFKNYELNKTFRFKFYLQLGNVAFVLCNSGANDCSIFYDPNTLIPLKVRPTSKPCTMMYEPCVPPLDNSFINLILWNSIRFDFIEV